MMTTMKPIYEFLLWDNCSNNCKFCFQRKNPRLYSLDEQQSILKQTLNYLNSDKYLENSHILLVGGELFDNTARFSMFSAFFDEIVKMLLDNKIDLLYLNTNLCYDKDCVDMLVSILQQFDKNDLFDRLKFTTSYDIAGRFSDNTREELFLRNIRLLTTRFPNLKIVANSILTNEFCDSILSDTFDLFEFLEKNKISANLIPYIILDTALAPSRKLVFQTIQKLYQEKPEFIRSWIENLDLKQPRKMFYFKNNIWNSCECSVSDCGHSVNFKRYSSANSCFVCDIKEVFNAIC